MGMGLSRKGDDAGMVLTDFEKEDEDLDADDGDDEDEEEEDFWTDLQLDEAESEEMVAEAEKHLERIKEELDWADVDDAGVEVSERLRKRPATLLRQELDEAMFRMCQCVGSM